MKYWFSSDTHFFHYNILKKFCTETREGETVQDMNNLIIQRHNERVMPDDEVWFLGDFSFGKLEETLACLKRMNGHKHLVLGNHDQVIQNNIHRFKVSDRPGDYGNENTFETIQHYKELTIEGKFVVLFHYPIGGEWNKSHHGSYHFYGHIHSNYSYLENPKSPGRSFDVGLDSRPKNYKMSPWSFAEIDAVLSKREPSKHHEKKGDL